MSLAMRAASVSAPAKVNLVLRVGVRDETGYHQLESLFCKLALADDVHVRVGDTVEDALTMQGPALPAAGVGPTERNLAWRALRAYRAATGWPGGAAITIEKRIPVGGGLGGGSADAAGVLRALDALAPTPLGTRGLMALGATLGADVPFLVSDAVLAWCWGRGDRLLALPPLPPHPLLLVAQTDGVDTASAYRWLAESGGGTARGTGWYDLSAFGTWADVAALIHNDFTAVVRARHAGVDAALRWLAPAVAAARDGGAASAGAFMSGSGATCAALLPAAARDWPSTSSADGGVAIWTETAAGVVGVTRRT